MKNRDESSFFYIVAVIFLVAICCVAIWKTNRHNGPPFTTDSEYDVSSVRVLRGNEFELELKTGRLMLGVLKENTVDDAKDKIVQFVNAQLDSGANAVVVVRGPVPGRQGAYFVDLSFFGGDQDIRLTDWLRDNHLIYQ